MKTIVAALGAAAFCAASASWTFAVTATSFGSFAGEEEPTVIYDVQSGFRSDSYDNMTNPSSGTFKFVLRYRQGDWWDGDRNTSSTDRQRAEVKGLGANQKNNETFDYAHTWKTSRGGSGSFWHVFQLKAVDGDNAPPLVVDSITSGSGAAVRSCSGTQSGFTVARSYGFSVGSFITTVVKAKVSTGTSGLLQASVNGGSFSGRTNISLYRPSATSYRPKWGSYRGVSSSAPYGDDTVEQKGVSANKR